jgi:hypothetical protein
MTCWIPRSCSAEVRFLKLARGKVAVEAVSAAEALKVVHMVISFVSLISSPSGLFG